MHEIFYEEKIIGLLRCTMLTLLSPIWREPKSGHFDIKVKRLSRTDAASPRTGYCPIRTGQFCFVRDVFTLVDPLYLPEYTAKWSVCK